MLLDWVLKKLSVIYINIREAGIIYTKFSLYKINDYTYM